MSRTYHARNARKSASARNARKHETRAQRNASALATYRANVAIRERLIARLYSCSEHEIAPIRAAIRVAEMLA